MSGTTHNQNGARRCAAGRVAMWVLTLVFLAGPLFAAPVGAAEIVKIRVGNHPTFTRVVFELDRPAGYRVERRGDAGSAELVVTLDAGSRARSISPRTAGVTKVEVMAGQDEAIAHIGLRKQGLRLKEMILANPPRIVLDIMRERPAVVAKPAPKPDPAIAKPTPAPAVEPRTPEPKVAKAVKPAPEPKVAKAVKPAPEPQVAKAVKPAPEPQVAKAVKPAPEPKVAKAVKSAPEPKVAKAVKPAPEPKVVKGSKPAPQPSAPTPAPEKATDTGEVAEALRVPGTPAPMLSEPTREAPPAAKPGRIAKADLEPATPALKTAESGEMPKLEMPAPVAKPTKPAARKPAAKTVAKKPETAKTTAPTSSESSSWMSSPIVLGAGAGLLLCVVGFALIVRRRRPLPNDLDVTAIADAAAGDPVADAHDTLMGGVAGAPATSPTDDLFGDESEAESEAASETGTPLAVDMAETPAAESAIDDLFDSDAEPVTATATMGDDTMNQEMSDLPADPEQMGSPPPPAAAPAAVPDSDVLRVVHELESRMGQLESKLEEANEARERLERQVAAQSEELRVQRAAIARTQRALRTMSRGDEDKATEPALRESDTQAKTRVTVE